jgi:nitroreductase
MRSTELPVASQFIDRWSPRAFTDASLDETTLLTMLEAGRWAPSAFNSQPWRFVYGLRGTAHFETLLAGLMPFNRSWAAKASALVVLVSATQGVPPMQTEPKPLTHAQFDCGAAWMAVALQAQLLGWSTHCMAGIEVPLLQQSLALPSDYTPVVAFAVGKQGDKTLLPEPLQAREAASPRKALAEIACAGRFPG